MNPTFLKYMKRKLSTTFTKWRQWQSFQLLDFIRQEVVGENLTDGRKCLLNHTKCSSLKTKKSLIFAKRCGRRRLLYNSGLYSSYITGSFTYQQNSIWKYFH